MRTASITARIRSDGPLRWIFADEGRLPTVMAPVVPPRVRRFQSPRLPSLADVALGYLATIVTQLPGDGRPRLPVDPLSRARQARPRRPARLPPRDLLVAALGVRVPLIPISE